MQESSLTLYIDQMLVKSRENLQRLEPYRELENILIYVENIKNKSGNLEYLIQYSQGVIAINVGEIPLNRKGVTAALLFRVWLRNSLLSCEGMSLLYVISIYNIQQNNNQRLLLI